MFRKILLFLLLGHLTCSVSAATHKYYGWTLTNPSSYPNGVFKLEDHSGWKCLKVGDRQPPIKLICYRTTGIFSKGFEIVSLPRKGGVLGKGKKTIKSVMYEGELNCSRRSSQFTRMKVYNGEFLSNRIISAPFKKNTPLPNRGSVMFHIFKDACE